MASDFNVNKTIFCYILEKIYYIFMNPWTLAQGLRLATASQALCNDFLVKICLVSNLNLNELFSAKNMSFKQLYDKL